jgi:hypothetical protein
MRRSPKPHSDPNETTMKIPAFQTTLTTLSMAIVLTMGWQVHAEDNRVKFPEIDKLVHYTTVKRGSVTEHIMTTPVHVAAGAEPAHASPR